MSNYECPCCATFPCTFNQISRVIGYSETPALDSLIADIEYAKNNSLVRDNSDPIFFKLAEALTEIQALLKGKL